MKTRDTVGTFEVAEAFAQFKMICCMHKHYSVEQWTAWAGSHPDAIPYVAVSAGTSEEDFNKIQTILTAVPAISFICLDVANGYSEFVSVTCTFFIYIYSFIFIGISTFDVVRVACKKNS